MKSLKNIMLFTIVIVASILFESCKPTQLIPGSNLYDNIIVISTTDSVNIAFKKLAQILISNGFPLENSDKELGIISTGAKNTSRLNGSIKINVIVNKKETTSITLTGLCKVNANFNIGYGATIVSDWQQISNYGMRGSIMQISWNDLYLIAQQYENGVISFSKK